MFLASKENIKKAVLTGVLIRVDGTRVDLGELARYDRNPFARMYHAVKRAFKRKI